MEAKNAGDSLASSNFVAVFEALKRESQERTSWEDVLKIYNMRRCKQTLRF